ncbi:MAG: FAD:protein FMN transferase [Nocardioidaceae bacterium]
MEATTFEALGTYVYLATRQDDRLPALHRLAAEILADVDRACSRFREDSDLTLANRHAGEWVEVDPVLVAAVSAAVSAARQTEGLVNPLLGRPLQQLGYDRDFHELVDVDEPALAGPPPPLDAWREIGLDEDGALRVPAGTALDLGATGKAWAADVIAAAATGELGIEAIVSLGGDIAITDVVIEPQPWPIAISTFPGQPAEAMVSLDRGGLATSSTRVRRWARRGVQLHHVLDPRTGLPAPTTWRTVTATGHTSTAANTASTAAIVLGADAPAWLESRGVDARLVAADGSVVRTGAWPVDDLPVDDTSDSERRGA